MSKRSTSSAKSAAAPLAPPAVDARPGGRRRSGAGVTLRDVATLAGVAPMTVSRVLREPASVSDSLREKVDTAVRSLGYVRNRVAGGLAGTRTDAVGVVVPSMHNAFFSDTLEALAEVIGRHDISLLVSHSGFDLEREADLVESMLSWRPRALVLTGVKHAERVHRMLARAGVPVIEMWEFTRRPIARSIGFSHRAVGRSLARHFAGNGYRRLGFGTANVAHDHRAKQVCAGFCDEARRLGLPEVQVALREGRVEMRQGREMMGELLDSGRRLDGVGFLNDVLAVGALFECNRRGVAVPGDIGLAGYGGLEMAAQSEPGITSVAPPSRRIGELVAAAIIDESSSGQRKCVDLGSALIARPSTAPRAAAR